MLMKLLIEKEKLIELYNQGFNNKEIADYFGCKKGESVRLQLLKLGLKSNFKYSDRFKIVKKDLVKLLEEGKSDKEISNILNVKDFTVTNTRIRLGFQKNIRSERFQLTDEQKQFIVGCVMGDGSLRLDKNCINPRFSCEHSMKQVLYCKHKFEILNGLEPGFSLHVRKQYNIFAKKYNYETCVVRLNNLPTLIPFYNMFYSTGKKIITKEVLEYYTPLAMAYHHMDDGSFDGKRYTNATLCFDEESLYNIQQRYLYYDIPVTFKKDKTLYINVKGQENFKELIRPYIIDSMKYKLEK